jgi:hypothetical protein
MSFDGYTLHSSLMATQLRWLQDDGYKKLRIFSIPPRSTVQPDIGLNVREIPLRWIWLKICMLMYLEVLKNV